MPLAISATPSTTSSKRLLLHEQARPGHAALAVVEEDRVGRALDRAVHGVVEHDVGALAAELQADLLQVARSRPATISLPTSVEPVKATLSTSSWAASAAPAVSPKPVTTFTTPSGMPASAMSSASRSAVSGVCSAGLRTTR